MPHLSLTRLSSDSWLQNGKKFLLCSAIEIVVICQGRGRKPVKSLDDSDIAQGWESLLTYDY